MVGTLSMSVIPAKRGLHICRFESCPVHTFRQIANRPVEAVMRRGRHHVTVKQLRIRDRVTYSLLANGGFRDQPGE